MSRVTGCLWLGIALILALVAGGAAFVTVQRGAAGPAGAQAPGAMTSVVVAVHPVAVGTLLTETDLSVQTIPSSVVPMGALGGVAEAKGRLTTVPLNTGEMVLSHHLTKPDITATNAAFTLPGGKIAVTLKASDLLSDAALAQSGDHVDILYSLKIANDDISTAPGAAASSSGNGATSTTSSRQYTFGSLQNVEVVSVIASVVKDSSSQATGTNGGSTNTPAAAGVPRSYVLALPPQDALVLKYLKDAGAVMDLGLRNKTDDTDHTAKPVDMKYIVDKFQLPVR